MVFAAESVDIETEGVGAETLNMVAYVGWVSCCWIGRVSREREKLKRLEGGGVDAAVAKRSSEVWRGGGVGVS